MDYKKLFHDESAFRREMLEAQMQDYGFKNMGRMELFLWDLELYLQIQDRLGDRVLEAITSGWRKLTKRMLV